MAFVSFSLGEGGEGEATCLLLVDMFICSQYGLTHSVIITITKKPSDQKYLYTLFATKLDIK